MSAKMELITRQRWRRGLLLAAFITFPATLYYFSPMLFLQGASEGLLSGSALVFAAQFLSSLLLGRLWCGWACPAGALQELARPVNNRRVPRWLGWLKWAIWLPWLGLFVYLAVRAGGIRAVEPLYELEGGLTLLQEHWYIIYCIVVGLFLGLALLAGRRAGCHAVCWMAPFMIAGRWLRNRLRWPALRLRANREACTRCGACTTACPMSIDVRALVQRGDMEHSACVLCASCADACPREVIRFSFRAGN